MKILYVISRPIEINTSASIRNKATIDGLVKHGHKIHLITSLPDKNHQNYDDSIKINGIETTYLELNGIQRAAKFARKFKLLNSLKNRIYKHVTKFDIYDNLKSIVKYTDKFKIQDGDYDLIISSSDPKSSHLFVRNLYEKQKLTNTPWIQIWGDPFLSDITRTNDELSQKIQNEEFKLLEHASKIIYVSRLTLKEQKITYKEYQSKMYYVPIPFANIQLYENLDFNRKQLSFLYAGDYTEGVRDILPLYTAIKDSNHKLVICGDSDIILENNNRIRVLPRVSYEEVKKLEEECDVLVHLSNQRGTQIPGKIYQYAGTNKPILFILDGDRLELRAAFDEYNRFIFCENSDKSILSVLNNFSSYSLDVLNNPVKEFESQNIAKSILDLL